MTLTTIKTIRRNPTKGVNKISVYLIKEGDYPEYIVIHDHDCLKERAYQIGEIRELGLEKVFISSFDQVVDSWRKGETWF